MNGILFRFLKFGVVGFTGVFIDFGITFLLKEKVKIQKYIANSCGFITAASSNYFLNRTWTFHSNNPKIFVEYSKFLIISLIGLLINNLIIYLLEKKLRFYFAKFIAIMITSLWNFGANYFLNFTH